MEKLTRIIIQHSFPSHIYERGLKYYQQGRVEGLSFDRYHDVWSAEVAGTENYFVEIDLSQLDVGTVSPDCECPAFHVYEQCKHIVATLLAICDMQDKYAPADEKQSTRFFEGLLKGKVTRQHDVVETMPMKVVYELSVDTINKVRLEMKTGIGHPYVVRDLRAFLDAVLSHEPLFFTKKFTYDPKEHYFLQQDIAIFRFVQKLIATGDVYTENIYHRGQSYDKRSVLIPPHGLETLLDKLTERTLSVEHNGHEYTNISVEKGNIPVEFIVTNEESSGLSLQVSGIESATYLEEYALVFKSGRFYFPEDKQLSLLNEMRAIGFHEQHLPISADMKDRFFSEVMPVIHQTADIRVSEAVQEEIIEQPLRAKFYLKMKDMSIIGSLAYHYGKYEIDPFSHAELNNELIIIRDVEKEERIMQLIEESNFRYNGTELFMDWYEEEDIYDFLYTILPKLDEYVEVYLTDDMRQLIVENEPIPSTAVSVQADTNLLEISFDISGIDDVEVEAMLQAVIEKKRYYRLNSGAIISLENEQYDSIRDLVTDLRVDPQQITDGTMTVPAYRSMQIDELVDLKKNYDPSFRKLLHQLQMPEQTTFPLPENLQATLRQYQEVGFQWFKSLSEYHLGGILADDMGLGKTLQTITYLLSEENKYPHLVVVPSSVVYNWRNECAKFAPSMQVAVISGSKEERMEKIKDAKNADIWIMSYGTARQDVDVLRDKTFHTLILDEAQFIKNHATKTAKAMQQIDARKRFALSGTPIENSIDELWSIFQVILPGFMPSLKKFRQLEHDRIATLTRPFILRRLKEDVLTELPEKIETTSVSELTKEQKDLYVGYLQQVREETSASLASSNFQQNRMKILAGITRLRQLCCHPSLFLEQYDGGSGKLEQLLAMIEQFKQDGKRMLIFSQFTSMHDIIIEELKQRGIDYFYINGATPAEDRVEMSEAFNNGEKSVFLISLRAGGTGLNLTGADTVILYDLWWNPAVEDQAAGRAHRFGQKNVVQVIRLIAEGTIEEKIYALQQKKRELIDQVIQPGEAMLSSLTEEDIRELLSM